MTDLVTVGGWIQRQTDPSRHLAHKISYVTSQASGPAVWHRSRNLLLPQTTLVTARQNEPCSGQQPGCRHKVTSDCTMHVLMHQPNFS